MNSGIGVGALPGKRTNLIGLNNEKPNGNITNILNKNIQSVGNTNIDSKFNPTQNAHLMSNLINLNLQLNKMVQFFFFSSYSFFFYFFLFVTSFLES